jgi:hypothetical protein
MPDSELVDIAEKDLIQVRDSRPRTIATDKRVVLLISWHILVQIIWHTRSFLAVPADPGKRLKLHIASEYAFPEPFHTLFATGAPNNKLRRVPDNARSNTGRKLLDRRDTAATGIWNVAAAQGSRTPQLRVLGLRNSHHIAFQRSPRCALLRPLGCARAQCENI